MDLIAKLPAVASMIYRTTFYDGEVYWGVVKGTFGTFCLSSQNFGKCQTFCGAKSAKSAKLFKNSPSILCTIDSLAHLTHI